MASVSGIFKSIENWFGKIFKNAPKWNVIALSTLNVVAPLIETVVGLAEPQFAPAVTSIFTQIQVDLGSASSLLAAGNAGGLTGLLNSIKSDFSTLLTEAHITNPESVAKAQAAEASITSELEAIIAAIPA